MLRTSERAVFNALKRSGIRSYNLPRPGLFASWEDAKSKHAFLEANRVGLKAQFEGFGSAQTVSGSGILLVDGAQAEKVNVQASTTDARQDYNQALLENLLWSTQRAVDWRGGKLLGVKVANNKDSIHVNIHVDGATPDSVQQLAVHGCTLLQSTDKRNVQFQGDKSLTSSENVQAGNTFLVKGLAAILASVHHSLTAAAQKEGVTIQGVEYKSELEVDTRGFVFGADQLSVAPSISKLFVKATVTTSGNANQVKSLGQAAESNSDLVNGLRGSNAKSVVAFRWVKSS